MPKRKYTKRNKEYWNNLSRANVNSDEGPKVTFNNFASAEEAGYEPEVCGEPYYISKQSSLASYTRTQPSGNRSSKRGNKNPYVEKLDRYSNIRRFNVPYSYDGDYISSRDAIVLCQKAYANVPIFRNTIDLMSEFANSSMYLEGGNAKSQDLIKKWLARVDIYSLKDQFFREYYRSGNVFHYKVLSAFTQKDIKNLKDLYSEAATGEDIPVRYILMNPADIVSDRSLVHDITTYKKLLSEYELKELNNPKNEQAQTILKNLPKDAQRKIKEKSYRETGVEVQLDPNLITANFYKKQDYEPFAIPAFYPVLDDINFKLELKKIDQSISRTVENVILLITMGAEPDKGGINYKHLAALQGIFASESAGRVLVSDYTTEAEFIIPDLNKVIGPQKYEIINKDIEQGLQNVLFSDSKYAGNEIKTKIFLKRLNDARNSFLRFIQAEIVDVCEKIGLRNPPEAKFSEIEMTDDVSLQKITTRLIELGILHPEDGIEVMRTRAFPYRDQIQKSQERLLREREDGWYNPLVGGIPVIEGPDGDNTPTAIPKQQKGRPEGKASKTYKTENVLSVIKKCDDFYENGLTAARKHYNKKRLSKEQKELISQACMSIVESTPMEGWDSKLISFFEGKIKSDDLEPLPEIKRIAAEHNIDYEKSSQMYHSDFVEIEKK